MKKSLLKYLYCPNCKEDLYLASYNNENEINKGSLKCVDCNETYEILNGVPIFCTRNNNRKLDLTAQNFAYSWQTFSSTQKDFYQKQFFDWLSPINKDFLKDKFVLDAGCGKGHHLMMISSYVKEAIGVDISDSAFIAYKNTKDLANIHIIQADLNHLPLKGELFDYIYSIGVVHHTEKPKLTTQNLYKKTKKDGSLSLWIYGRENNWWIIYFIDPLRKSITTFFPAGFIHLLSIFFAVPLFLVLKLIYLPVSKFRLLKPLSKILFYYSYLSYICKFDFNEINNITFDHLVAPTSHYLSKKEVEDLISLNGNQTKIKWHNQNSWRIYINKK